MTATPPLREACAWALGRVGTDPALTRRAEAALARCLVEVERSCWPGAVAYFSRLNADGCPVEIACSSRDEALRFTSEIAAPEAPAAGRLAAAVRWLETLGHVAPPGLLALGQARGRCRWGASIGYRATEAGERCKVYAEVTSECAADRPTVPPGWGHLPARARWVMSGWESESGRVEQYFSVDSLSVTHCRAWLDSLGLGSQRQALEEAVETACGDSLGRALDGRWGLSVATPGGADGAGGAVATLFKVANQVLGRDGQVRAKLPRLATRLGVGSFERYDHLTEGLDHDEGAGAHGMLGLSISSSRPLELRIGVSPMAAWRAIQRGLVPA